MDTTDTVELSDYRPRPAEERVASRNIQEGTDRDERRDPGLVEVLDAAPPCWREEAHDPGHRAPT
jgi:hypothetical protein